MMVHRYWCGPDEPPVDGPVWHDTDLPDALASWCDERMGQVCGIDAPRHRSNMVRWWLLLEHGGLWLDHDALLHQDPPEGPWVASHRGHACAAAIHLPPGHELAWAMLHHIDHQPPSDRPCPQVSGAYPLTTHARRLGVPMVEIPGPDDPPTWIEHRWVTSMLRRA